MKFKFTKQSKLVLLMVSSLGCGLLAAYAAKGYLKQELDSEKARLKPNQVTVDIVVAKQDLPKGTVVSAEHMAVRAVPKEFVSSSAIKPDRFDSFIGSKLNAALKSGEQVLVSNTEGADVATFASKVKPGIRAITVGVDEITSVSGMLQPADRIDLLWSVKPSALKLGDSQSPEQTVVFMQDVRVLATGKQVRPGADETRPRGYTTVTLEATATQAQQLVVAQRSGKLTALLRNPEDNLSLSRKATDLSHLLDIRPLAAPVIAVVKQGPEILVGGKGDLAKQRQLAAAGDNQ